MGENKDAATIWRGPVKIGVIRQFISDIDWPDLDYLIIDSPPGTGDEPLTVAQTIRDARALIVTTPQEISLADVRKSINFCHQVGMFILGVVENMSYLELPDGTRMDVFGSGGGEKLAKEAGVPFIGAIPLDPAVREGGDEGNPVILSHPTSMVSKSLKTISEELAAKVSVAAMKEKNVIPINMVG
jgi:Mrp family chromosome partitioning ATPase